MSGESMDLVWPHGRYLAGYVQALQQGWSPDNLRPQAALDELARIAEDPERFVSEQVDREAKGPAITLPDGKTVPRLPGYSMWMWDGEFCGSIGFRWQPGTTELPPYSARRVRAGGYSGGVHALEAASEQRTSSIRAYGLTWRAAQHRTPWDPHRSCECAL
jgi:hypothetical protein